MATGGTEAVLCFLLPSPDKAMKPDVEIWDNKVTEAIADVVAAAELATLGDLDYSLDTHLSVSRARFGNLVVDLCRSLKIRDCNSLEAKA